MNKKLKDDQLENLRKYLNQFNHQPIRSLNFTFTKKSITFKLFN